MTSEITIRDLVPLLRTADMEAYLIRHRWEKLKFSRPEIVCFRGPADDRGKPITLALPASEQFGDFAARVEEVLSGLAIIERRSALEIVREAVGLPSAIVPTEIKAAGLVLNPACKADLAPLLASTDHAFVSSNVAPGPLFECTGEIAHVLSRKGNLKGREGSKKSVIWWICKKIVGMAGWQFRVTAADVDLWNAARRDDAVNWLLDNTVEAEETPTTARSRGKGSAVP